MKHLTHPELLNQTRKLAADERRIGIEILHHLREVRARRLHLDLGYSSLFSFCVAELKYSEAAAYQKIQALKLMDEVPEVEQKLEAGTLTVSNAAQVQSFAQAAKKRSIPAPHRAELVAQVENRSKREAQQILANLSPTPLISEDRCRPVSPEHSEVRFTASARLLAKLDRLRSLRSHVNANPSMAEFFEDMADLLLKKLDPELHPGKAARRPNPSRRETLNVETSADQTLPGGSTQAPKATRRAIPQAIRRQVWKRDGGACVYSDPNTHKRCGSRHLIQIDHKLPLAKGGSGTVENLRLLCSNHNLLAAHFVFGSKLMGAYAECS